MGEAVEQTAGARRGWSSALGLAAPVAAVLAWVWPLGLGGRMPVGGDVTQFQIGLMGVLGRALGERRLPLWNDLWGWGFPGLAESQMGVYYPPHLVLYGLLTVEAAYTASLALHLAWAALGAAWAARRFGAGAAGSAVAGVAFGGCGFFLIHQTHQWAYSVGAWMPWAWGLGWTLVRGETPGRPARPLRTALTLAAVLAVQMLPGHFQLAFVTQVGLLALAAIGLVDRAGAEGAGTRGRLRGLAIVAALAGAGGLAAAQLIPTWELARRAESDRTAEYLSGFAAAPPHLVSYVAPALFHRSPLWRSLAWDPLHTSPEEHLGSVGLVPLFLALVALTTGLRRDRATRALAMLLALTVLLSLGPYAPGFGLLSKLPGFSFFRGPARWGLGTMLALSLLAGLGFDRLGRLARPSRSLAWFAIAAAVPPLLAVAVVELAFWSTDGPGDSAVAGAFEAARRTLPWPDDPKFRAVMATARQPSDNPIVVAAQTRRGGSPRARLDRERLGIYVEELAGTAALLAGLLGLAALARRPGVLPIGLAVLLVGDLAWLRQQRDLETAPIRPLRSQSPVLARLAEAPRPTRTLDPFGNLPMLVGAAPVRAYRTLDLPTMTGLTAAAAGSVPGLDAPRLATARRSVGARLVVGQGGDPVTPGGRVETVTDPELAGWISGAAWVAAHPEVAAFRIETLSDEPAQAWLVSDPAPLLAVAPPSIAAQVGLLDQRAARPLPATGPVPERLEVGPIDVATPGAAVLLTRLYDPEWTAVWVASDGAATPGAVEPAVRAATGGGAWQLIRAPGPGRWTVRLQYEGRAARRGQFVSAVAWLGWLALFAAARREPRRPVPGPGPQADRGNSGMQVKERTQ